MSFIKRVEGLVRSPAGRLLAAAAGLLVLTLLVRHTGPKLVWAAVTRSPALFPLIVLLEAVCGGCEVWGLYLLYGPDRHKVPKRELVRSGLICYAVMAAVPLGRAVGEATRAAMLAKYIGGAKAAAAAARMQGVTLLGNAAISIPCFGAAYWLLGPSWLPAAIAANFAVATVLGGGILVAGRYSRVGSWFSRRFRSGHEWGPALDLHLKGESAIPKGPLFWVFAGRSAQTVQRVVLLAAVGAGFGLLRGLCAEGINLVNALVGDIVPSQIGIAEASYTLSAQVLSVSRSDGIAIALIAHLGQLFWLGVGSIVPLVWPPPKVLASPAS